MKRVVAAAIEAKTVTWFLTVLILVAGIASYFQLGRLEDPDFTIKRALVITQYPGATAEEVEQEVTDRIETALQTMPQLDKLYSISRPGLSIITVDMQQIYWADRLPQVWDEMRNEIRDVQSELPPGAGIPQVLDDFSFVYGFVLAVTADGFSYAELEEYVKRLRRELSLVPGVARTELWGVQPRVVYLDVSTTAIAELGITPDTFVSALQGQGAVVDAGFVEVPRSRFRVDVGGAFDSPDDIGALQLREALQQIGINADQQAAAPGGSVDLNTLRMPSDELLAVQDIATVRADYLDPPQTMMRFNGFPAYALALANVAGGNIIDTGAAIEARLEELRSQLPAGIEVHKVAWQSDLVDRSIVDFSINLGEAVVIVLVVVALALGLRMGLIIGAGLILTILTTFIVMAAMDIPLHRVSLGSLVIALGMMVDNAIVVADGMMVRMQKGMDPKQAAIESAALPAWPLLGATIIAVMAFFPVFAAVTDGGEYARTLFIVVGISLITSWVLSVTVTPLQCLALLKPPKLTEGAEGPGEGGLLRTFRKLLAGAIRFRLLTIAGLTVLLFSSLWQFQTIEQQFFPDSTREQFMVDFWAPEGTPIQTVSARLRLLEERLDSDERVSGYATFVGAGGPRFYLPVDPELPYPSFGQVVVNTTSLEGVDTLIADLRPWVAEIYPEALVRLRKYSVGPSDTWPFELRVTGPGDAELATLRALGEEGMAILRNSPLATDVRIDMRQRVPHVLVDYNQDRGRRSLVSRQAVADSIRRSFDGLPVGLYREGDTLLPIILRSVETERQMAAEQIDVLQVQPELMTDTVPLGQVADNVIVTWEESVIPRFNRRREVAIQASALGATFPTLRASVLEEFEALEARLPPGYEMFWDGEYDSTLIAQQSLIPGAIPALAIVAVIVVGLFNALRPALIIALAIPFAVIGITYSLLATNTTFTFMALLGAMSLVGMMIKNAIVLLDEVNRNLSEGRSPYQSVTDAAVSRLRPVSLAALTTILGVAPLIQDVFWVSMAITIMGGLAFGTVVTMVLVPVLYAAFHGISAKSGKAPETRRKPEAATA